MKTANSLTMWLGASIVSVSISLVCPAQTIPLQKSKWLYRDPASGKTLHCDWCEPGEYMYRPCTENTITECRPCPPEQYTEHHNNATECFPCKKCVCKVKGHENEVLPCTAVQNRQCGECDKRYREVFEILQHTASNSVLGSLGKTGSNKTNDYKWLPQWAVAVAAVMITISVIMSIFGEHLTKRKGNFERREIERLETELRGEREAKRCLSDLCRRLEEEIASHKNQAETDKREIGRLREQLVPSSGCCYKMSEVPRGVAVIINNIHFQIDNMANRDGAEADTDRLREAFENLQFTVLTFHDLDHAKMVTVMMEQGKADHFNYDCFVCCVMSHGTMGKVFSSNNIGIEICELMNILNAKRCPSLKGKPKLFFIQACQGEKRQGREGVDGDYDAKPAPFICHEADFFLGLSTVPGYVARRDHDGAPYVHHLANMLKDLGKTHDLSTIMAMVCDKMNEINDDKFGWISSNHSTLRKKVVFNTQ